MVDAASIRERYTAVGRSLNERSRRLFAAAEARTAGYGGISAAARATGVARSTIGRGLKDLDAPDALSGVVRHPGSGRRALPAMDATLLEDLRRLLEPATKGDPMRPLPWVSKSHAKLAAALCTMGHRIGKSSIPKLLGLLQYRRQVNRKTLEGSRNPDRDAQFEHINAAVTAMQSAGQPVISVDTAGGSPRRFAQPMALPCGSRSTSSTRLPRRTPSAARFTASVVLPAPPFWLTSATFSMSAAFILIVAAHPRSRDAAPA